MPDSNGDTPRGLWSQVVNLATLLTRAPTLKVPIYQRPYTWGEREVRRLIQDLMHAFKSQMEFYFIGQIVFVKFPNGTLEISDGQQRLATLTMILAYVRDRLPQRAAHFQEYIIPKGGQPRLVLREDDVNFFWGYVQEPGHTSEMRKLGEIGIDSRDLMCLAVTTIENELRDSDRDLDAFMNYILRCATFNIVDADDRGCAATVYNTVNDRGLELSAADIIKCELLEKGGLSKEDADQAAKMWEKLEDDIGRWNFAKLLGLMPFLLMGGEMIAPSDLKAFRERVMASGGVRTFLFDRLKPYAEALRDILYLSVDIGPASEDVNRRIKMMKQINDDWAWAPAAIACLAEHKNSPENVQRFFQALDLFSWACDLSVIDNRRRAKRYADAANGANAAKAFLEGGPLWLSQAERNNLVSRLNRPFRRDHALRRRLMLRIEAAMKDGKHLTVRDNASVEHVLPLQGGGNWWGGRFNDKVRREEDANLLGNFVLITDKQNKACADKSFPDKRNIYFKTPGAPMFAVTRHIEPVHDWTHETIVARQYELVRTLCEDWGFSID